MTSRSGAFKRPVVAIAVVAMALLLALAFAASVRAAATGTEESQGVTEPAAAEPAVEAAPPVAEPEPVPVETDAVVEEAAAAAPAPEPEAALEPEPAPEPEPVSVSAAAREGAELARTAGARVESTVEDVEPVGDVAEVGAVSTPIRDELSDSAAEVNEVASPGRTSRRTESPADPAAPAAVAVDLSTGAAAQSPGSRSPIAIDTDLRLTAPIVTQSSAPSALPEAPDSHGASPNSPAFLFSIPPVFADASGQAPARSASDGPTGPPVPDLPPPAQIGAEVGAGGTNFLPLLGLLALLALAAPRGYRRRMAVRDFPVPTPFVCALERPG